MFTGTNPSLATRFAHTTHVIRSEQPLAEDQMRMAAPSIFAQGKHASRSERYTYIPTIEVLRGLRREGFEPFMVAQGKSRVEGKTEYTIRMRHAAQVEARPEANEIRPSGRDRYGRTVARVTCAGTDANAAMVRAGMAWASARYLTDPQIRGMEVVERREGLGLWSDAHPVPPWEWRKSGAKRNTGQGTTS